MSVVVLAGKPFMWERDILIVDDEPDVRDVLAGVLRNSGYAVDVAATVNEATSTGAG